MPGFNISEVLHQSLMMMNVNNLAELISGGGINNTNFNGISNIQVDILNAARYGANPQVAVIDPLDYFSLQQKKDARVVICRSVEFEASEEIGGLYLGAILTNRSLNKPHTIIFPFSAGEGRGKHGRNLIVEFDTDNNVKITLVDPFGGTIADGGDGVRFAYSIANALMAKGYSKAKIQISSMEKPTQADSITCGIHQLIDQDLAVTEACNKRAGNKPLITMSKRAARTTKQCNQYLVGLWSGLNDSNISPKKALSAYLKFLIFYGLNANAEYSRLSTGIKTEVTETVLNALLQVQKTDARGTKIMPLGYTEIHTWLLKIRENLSVANATQSQSRDIESLRIASMRDVQTPGTINAILPSIILNIQQTQQPPAPSTPAVNRRDKMPKITIKGKDNTKIEINYNGKRTDLLSKDWFQEISSQAANLAWVGDDVTITSIAPAAVIKMKIMGVAGSLIAGAQESPVAQRIDPPVKPAAASRETKASAPQGGMMLAGNDAVKFAEKLAKLRQLADGVDQAIEGAVEAPKDQQATRARPLPPPPPPRAVAANAPAETKPKVVAPPPRAVAANAHAETKSKVVAPPTPANATRKAASETPSQGANELTEKLAARRNKVEQEQPPLDSPKVPVAAASGPSTSSMSVNIQELAGGKLKITLTAIAGTNPGWVKSVAEESKKLLGSNSPSAIKLVGTNGFEIECKTTTKEEAASIIGRAKSSVPAPVVRAPAASHPVMFSAPATAAPQRVQATSQAIAGGVVSISIPLPSHIDMDKLNKSVDRIIRDRDGHTMKRNDNSGNLVVELKNSSGAAVDPTLKAKLEEALGTAIRITPTKLRNG